MSCKDPAYIALCTQGRYFWYRAQKGHLHDLQNSQHLTTGVLLEYCSCDAFFHHKAQSELSFCQNPRSFQQGSTCRFIAIKTLEITQFFQGNEAHYYTSQKKINHSLTHTANLVSYSMTKTYLRKAVEWYISLKHPAALMCKVYTTFKLRSCSIYLSGIDIKLANQKVVGTPSTPDCVYSLLPRESEHDIVLVM